MRTSNPSETALSDSEVQKGWMGVGELRWPKS